MKLLADLHVHSRASADGRSSVEALIEAARARSLAAITVSDHDLCTPLPDSPDVLLIPGVEITSANGHILGLFLDRPIDFAALGRYPAPEKAIEAIHACGGLAVLAHPFAPVKLSEDQISKLPGTRGSDAHCAKELGGCVTEFTCEPSLSALKAALLSGQCHPVEVRACKWVWKGFSKLRRERTCGTFVSRCKALSYFAGCVLRDILKI